METDVPRTFEELWAELERKLSLTIRPEVRRWAEDKYGGVMEKADSQGKLALLELLQQDLSRMRVGGVQIAASDSSASHGRPLESSS